MRARIILLLGALATIASSAAFYIKW